MMIGIILFLLASCRSYPSYPNHPSNPSYPSYPLFPELHFGSETTEVEGNQNTVEEPRPSCMEDLGEPGDMKLLIRLKREVEVGCGVSGQD